MLQSCCAVCEHALHLGEGARIDVQLERRVSAFNTFTCCTGVIRSMTYGFDDEASRHEAAIGRVGFALDLDPFVTCFVESVRCNISSSIVVDVILSVYEIDLGLHGAGLGHAWDSDEARELVCVERIRVGVVLLEGDNGVVGYRHLAVVKKVHQHDSSTIACKDLINLQEV